MKAIQIKFLGATNTKGARLKAWTESGIEIESLDYSTNCETQARAMADRFIKKMQWNVIVSGFGSLPNGDWVATLS